MTDLHDTINFITTEAAKIARQWLLQCIAYTSFVRPRKDISGACSFEAKLVLTAQRRAVG